MVNGLQVLIILSNRSILSNHPSIIQTSDKRRAKAVSREHLPIQDLDSSFLVVVVVDVVAIAVAVDVDVLLLMCCC